jgi:hypothetical protein
VSRVLVVIGGWLWAVGISCADGWVEWKACVVVYEEMMNVKKVTISLVVYEETMDG